jgi:hypothetical protein
VLRLVKRNQEESARQTFEALAQVIPGEKLRFLQYVNAKSEEWWAAHQEKGAVVLAKKPYKGKATHEAAVITASRWNPKVKP